MEFNLADVHDAVSAAIGDRECIVWRDRRLTYAQVAERTNRLANHLVGGGPRCPHRARARWPGTRAGRTTSAFYLHNGNEYLEAMLGAYKARVAPFNVNYRYVAEELRYLLDDAGARAIVFHAAFADRLAEVLPDLPDLDRPAAGRRRQRRRAAPGAVVVRGGAGRRPPRRARRSSGAPTTSTSSTPAAPPACPRACSGGRPTSSSGAMGGRNLATGEEWRGPRRGRGRPP